MGVFVRLWLTCREEEWVVLRSGDVMLSPIRDLIGNTRTRTDRGVIFYWKLYSRIHRKDQKLPSQSAPYVQF